MSAASRYKATAPQRERRRVARELAGHVELYWDHGGICQSLGWTDAAAALLDPARGLRLDVHAANEHAESLIALEAEQDAFERWANTTPPGPKRMPVDPRHLPRIWAYMCDGDRRAPMGRSLAKLGRAIQRALKGQPSECQADDCSDGLGPWVDGEGPCGFRRCPDCGGSGHNLRGVLPPVEWSAQVRRRRQDAEAHRTRRTGNDIHTYGWDDWINESGIHGGVMWRGEMTDTCYGDPGWTRVVPRGTHRTFTTTEQHRALLFGEDPRGPLSHRINGEWAPMASMSVRRDRETTVYHDGYWASCRPRWRRGELRHAEQRRNRGQS